MSSPREPKLHVWRSTSDRDRIKAYKSNYHVRPLKAATARIEEVPKKEKEEEDKSNDELYETVPPIYKQSSYSCLR